MGAGAVQSLTQNLFEEDSMCRALAAEAIGDLATISGRTGCIALVGARRERSALGDRLRRCRLS